MKLAVWWNRLGTLHVSNHVHTLVTVKLITAFGRMTGDLLYHTLKTNESLIDKWSDKTAR